VAWLPLMALAGTVVGSALWGWLADIYGRRAAILLSSVMFIGTAICGAMPLFEANLVMCFMMGAAAGGLLPVAYALLAETMPTRHRGWSLVLVGGIGAVGGYFAASLSSALLQPLFGWRVMWFLNLPTGLALIALSPLLPESARFLQQMGRGAEALKALSRFGAVARLGAPADAPQKESHSALPPVERKYLSLTGALTLTALAWGFVNFGLLVWLPDALVSEGRSVAAASRLISQSTLIAAPVVIACVLLYSRWSTKWSLVLMLAVMAAGLSCFVLRTALPAFASPLIPLVLVIIGSSGVISIILPYAAENYPLRVRGRATGWVAGASKFGGLTVQLITVAALAPSFPVAGAAIGVVAVVALIWIGLAGRETKGRDLRELG
jgi:MFS transporter, putative metabolite:H+ symporter